MARLAALSAVWVALLSVVVMAQTYPHLHVLAFGQHVDRATVDAGGIFHLTIHVKVAQRRDRLDELILGAFSDCEIISNETVRTAAPDGTDFVERLTVQAMAPGDAVVSPAYIDALDPTIGKPMRFSSNAVRVHIRGAAPIAGMFDEFGERARRLLLALTIGISIVAAVFVVTVLFVRRNRRPGALNVAPETSAPTPSPPVAAPVAPAHERLAAATRTYLAQRSPAALADVRRELFALAGAPQGTTLLDALVALGNRDADVRAALLAAEAAAFGPAAQRTTAGDAMAAAIQAYCRRGPANETAWTR